MTTYKGPVTVVTEEGREIPVTANLQKGHTGGGRTSWGGTLSLPANQQPIELTNLQQGTLRVGEDDARFIRPDISDWLGSPTGQFQIEILGNGEAPF